MDLDPTRSPDTLADALDTVRSDLDPLNTRFDALDDVDLRPAASAAVVPAPADTALARIDEGAARRGGAGRDVLVVDSTPIARKFLAQRLQSLGYLADLAENGEQALAMVTQRAYAIVLIETMLGPQDGVDGLLLCRAIKRKADHAGGKAPAVVMVTGMASSSDRIRGMLAGCDAYLAKPVVDAQLIAALGEVDPLFN